MKRLATALSLMGLMMSPLLGYSSDNTSQVKPWESFRGVAFGASESDALKLIPNLKCRQNSSNNKIRADRMCYEIGYYIGDVLIKFNGFGFKNDKLIDVYLQFNPDNFACIKDLFIKKYGIPFDNKEYTIRTRIGVSYDNEEIVWRNNRVMLTLKKYAGSIDKSTAFFMDISNIDERIKEKSIEKEKALTDF